MMRNYVVTCLLALLTSCGIFAPSDPPRVSTEAERATANAYLGTAATLLEAARVSGWVDQATYDKGHESLRALKARIDASATVPTSWAILMDDALNMALRWVPAKK